MTMPDTVEFPALSTPSAALGANLGWRSSSETPLPITVFVDGPDEAVLIGRTAPLAFTEYEPALLIARQLLGRTRPQEHERDRSSAITTMLLEALTHASDQTRAHLRLLRESLRYTGIPAGAATELAVEPRRTLRTSVPLKLTPLGAAHELKHWLNISWDALGAATAITPGTFHYWQSTKPTPRPRPSTLVGLYRLHASMAAARSAAVTDARFNEWLEVGGTAGDSPRELALAGDLDSLRVEVQRLVFADMDTPAVPRSRRFDVGDLDAGEVAASPAGGPPLRRKTTRRARARLK